VLGAAGATMDVATGGATAATDALQAGGVYNSTLPTLTTGQGAAIQLDSSARQIMVGAGAAGTAAGGVVTVQGITSMTPLLTNPGSPGNWGVQAQGSTTSGESGTLAQGAVTTSVPSYASGQTDPLSLDTSGSLRVNCTTGCGSLSWPGTASPSNYGTAPTGSVPGVNADITNTPAVNLIDQAGTALGTPANFGTAPSTSSPALSANDAVLNWGGAALNSSSSSTYGTAPTGTVPGVNAFVTNSNGNGQATMANSSPVVIASNQSVADPCMFQAKTSLAISTNATFLNQIIAASGSTKIYICSLAIVVSGATVFNLDTGTGTNCGTSTAAVMGSTTATNGLSFAANGGLMLGNGGNTVAVANVSGAELCTLQSNPVYLSGNLTYVQQ